MRTLQKEKEKSALLVMVEDRLLSPPFTGRNKNPELERLRITGVPVGGHVLTCSQIQMT